MFQKKNKENKVHYIELEQYVSVSLTLITNLTGAILVVEKTI